MSNIINAIIAKAKALKKTQSELAASIGMSPEAFSRAKKRGDMRLSDIQSMATAVGMRVNLLDLPVMTSGTPNTQINRNLRRCELLGLEFPYDWSLGFMSDELIVEKVLDRFIFHDVVIVCCRFGFDFVFNILLKMKLGEELNPIEARSMNNIKEAIS